MSTYLLTDDLAADRTLYPGPVLGAPDVLLIDIPAQFRGPGLLAGRYYPVLLESETELDEMAQFLALPRNGPAPLDRFDQRPSAVVGNGVMIAQYEPPHSLLPWLVVCRWPRDLADAAQDKGIAMARGCYTSEVFDTAAAMRDHCAELLASLGSNRTIKVRLIGTDQVSLPGRG